MKQSAPTPQQPLTEEQALSRCAALCSRGEQCASQIRKKLDQWQVPAEAQERIVARLQEERYIDEERFARAFARDKARYDHWGPVRIDQQLRLLGISRDHRQSAIGLFSEEEQGDTLRQLLARKARSVKGNSAYERRGKLIRFALGRGFEMNDILKNLPPDTQDADGEWQ